MHHIQRSAIVPYSARQMFDLVADISRYGEFLPWCREACVLGREGDTVRAAIGIAWHGLDRSFTTLNVEQPGQAMVMRLEQGPFRELIGEWRFDALGDAACKVSLDLRFEFDSRMLDLVAAPVFGRIANSLVDSFHERARALHGER